MDRLGLGLGPGPHIVGRLGSGMRMRVSASFRIIPRPVGRLGLGLESGSEPHDVGRLGSGLRVGGLSPRIFFISSQISGLPGGVNGFCKQSSVYSHLTRITCGQTD